MIRRVSIALLLVVALIVLCALSPGAQSAAPGLAPDVIARVEQVIARQMSLGRIPGLSISIVTDLQERWSNGYGLADLENMVPAKADRNYRYASIAKAMIATAIMQLVEAGKLDLDAPMQTYAPAFPKKQWPVTTRHLINNVSGVRAYKGAEFDSTQHYTNVTSTLDVFKNDPLSFEPGTKYFYSSYNFILLEAVLEGASGTSYPDYMRAHIFEPAGMDHTGLDDVFEILPNRTQGYRKLPNGALVNSNLADTSNKGALRGTVGDLAKFAIAYLSGRLVRPETVQDMFAIADVSKRSNQECDPIAYAKGWNTCMHGGEREIYHAGNQQRVTGLLYMRPARKVVVAMLCNLEAAPLTVRMAREISNIVLGETRTSE